MPSKTDSMVAVTCNDFFSTCINLVSVRTGNNKNGMLSVCCATLFLISFILGSSTCALMVDIYFFFERILAHMETERVWLDQAIALLRATPAS